MGVDWSSESGTCANVGRASGEIPTLMEIESGNTAGSYVIWKVEGAGPSGEAIVDGQMPLFNPPLTAATIQNMRDWIADGTPGCGGTGPPPPEPPPPPPPPGSPPPPDTWATIQADILQVRCVLCHNNSPNAPMGLSWEADQYDIVVTAGRISGEVPPMRIIEPGNSAASYMVWKINGQGPSGEAIVGVRMPASGPPFLAQADIDRITAWIDAGAPRGDPGGGGDPGTSDPTFPVGSWMYVWTEALQICSLCHSLTPSSARCGVDFACPPKGVVLTADNYTGVVDDSIVRPFRPDNSKLWERVTENDPDKRMPFGLDPLSQRQLGIIRDWIMDGAPFCPAGEVCP